MRNDSGGSGDYGAKRGDRIHKGTDFLVVPGEKVFAPISGFVSRIAYPYTDTKAYSGLIIENSEIRVKMFYFLPFPTVIGQEVELGQEIGIAQDISKRYGGGMRPHIHLEIDHMNPMLLINLP